jgi:hypothetical protein
VPRLARGEYLNPGEMQIVHACQRCVRRAFLCGTDEQTGKSKWASASFRCVPVNCQLCIWLLVAALLAAEAGEEGVIKYDFGCYKKRGLKRGLKR